MLSAAACNRTPSGHRGYADDPLFRTSGEPDDAVPEECRVWASGMDLPAKRGHDESMAIAMGRQFFSLLPELRYEPTIKRIRVFLGDEPVADTTSARLIWEPKRVVPSYAVPESDMSASVEPAAGARHTAENPVALGEGLMVLDPRSGFGAHTTPGQALTVVTSSGRAEGAAFRFDDPDLDGYMVLDFYAFDWLEEDEPIVGHPRDPFGRIDIRRSSRHIRLEHEGLVLTESTRPHLLFESGFLMARYYLPREDVTVELKPGTARTTCAYKGHATHYDAMAGDQKLPNIAWSYEDPLSDATQVQSMVSFYQERLDLFVDGDPVPRPRTPWS